MATITARQLLAEAPAAPAKLLAELAAMRRAWPHAGLAYRGPADFVLRHGTLKRGARLPPGCEAAPQTCYWNALIGSLARGWAYVEGFALHPAVSAPAGRALPVAHAWNEDPAGTVIDTTWAQLGPALALGAYVGVRFTAARAHDCTWHGDACVLADTDRGWGVLREPWEHEASPGPLEGLVGRVAADMRAAGGEYAAQAAVLERRSRDENWPGL